MHLSPQDLIRHLTTDLGETKRDRAASTSANEWHAILKEYHVDLPAECIDFLSTYNCLIIESVPLPWTPNQIAAWSFSTEPSYFYTCCCLFFFGIISLKNSQYHMLDIRQNLKTTLPLLPEGCIPIALHMQYTYICMRGDEVVYVDLGTDRRKHCNWVVVGSSFTDFMLSLRSEPDDED